MLTFGIKLVITGAVSVLTAYAYFWLRQNLRLEGLARDALEAHDMELGITPYNESINATLRCPDAGIVIGYKLTVILLALAATIATFIPL